MGKRGMGGGDGGGVQGTRVGVPVTLSPKP